MSKKIGARVANYGNLKIFMMLWPKNSAVTILL
jgi:hypothetical protein